MDRKSWLLAGAGVVALVLTAVGSIAVDNSIRGSRAKARARERMEKIEARRAQREQTQRSIMESFPDPVGTFTASPAASENPQQERELQRAQLARDPTLPSFHHDILAQMNVIIDNELDDVYGITQESIRDAADVSYEALGIVHQGIRGWTVVVRSSGDPNIFGGSTQVDEGRERIIVNVNPLGWVYVAPHEMTHVLMAPMLVKDWLPNFVEEFVAATAEIEQPPEAMANQLFDYNRLNRALLGTSRTIHGETDTIREGALDGMRYDLLRLGAQKIGDDRARELARDIYEYALDRQGPVVLSELQPFFVSAGLADCVLFHQTQEPGLYVDVTTSLAGSPVILYKQVDDAGVESVFQAPLRLTWRKDSHVLGNWEGMTPPTGLMIDDMGSRFGALADTYEVTLGTTRYTYRIR